MAAYSGVSKRFKDALVGILSAIDYDGGNGAEPAFVSVVDNTKDEYDAYPVLRVLPGHIDDQKGATGQNDRTVNFMLIGHLPLEDVATVPSVTFDQMYNLTDLIIDQLDNADFDNQLQTIDPSIPTFLLNVTRGDWTTEPTKAGAQLTWNIDVEVSYSKDLS